jgi:hypothetical protein
MMAFFWRRKWIRRFYYRRNIDDSSLSILIFQLPLVENNAELESRVALIRKSVKGVIEFAIHFKAIKARDCRRFSSLARNTMFACAFHDPNQTRC